MMKNQKKHKKKQIQYNRARAQRFKQTTAQYEVTKTNIPYGYLEQ